MAAWAAVAYFRLSTEAVRVPFPATPLDDPRTLSVPTAPFTAAARTSLDGPASFPPTAI